jgi:hypothetical protein
MKKSMHRIEGFQSTRQSPRVYTHAAVGFAEGYDRVGGWSQSERGAEKKAATLRGYGWTNVRVVPVIREG